MAKSRDGGFPVLAAEFSEAITDSLADCVIQNPENSMLYLVLSDTKPADDFKGANRIPPYEAWVRSDTEGTPILQGKVWLRADKDIIVPVIDPE